MLRTLLRKSGKRETDKYCVGFVWNGSPMQLREFFESTIGWDYAHQYCLFEIEIPDDDDKGMDGIVPVYKLKDFLTKLKAFPNTIVGTVWVYGMNPGEVWHGWNEVEKLINEI